MRSLQDTVSFCARMIFRRDHNHVLMQDRDKGNIRFIRNKRAKDHIVAVGFESLDHIGGMCLVEIEGNVLVSVQIQEGADGMGNIVVR